MSARAMEYSPKTVFSMYSGTEKLIDDKGFNRVEWKKDKIKFIINSPALPFQKIYSHLQNFNDKYAYDWNKSAIEILDDISLQFISTHIDNNINRIDIHL